MNKTISLLSNYFLYHLKNTAITEAFFIKICLDIYRESNKLFFILI